MSKYTVHAYEGGGVALSSNNGQTGNLPYRPAWDWGKMWHYVTKNAGKWSDFDLAPIITHPQPHLLRYA